MRGHWQAKSDACPLKKRERWGVRWVWGKLINKLSPDRHPPNDIPHRPDLPTPTSHRPKPTCPNSRTPTDRPPTQPTRVDTLHRPDRVPPPTNTPEPPTDTRPSRPAPPPTPDERASACVGVWVVRCVVFGVLGGGVSGALWGVWGLGGCKKNRFYSFLYKSICY